MELLNDIEVVNNITAEEFNRRFFYPQKPVVIKGLADRTYAGAHWSINYFKETMGNLLVDVFDNSNKKASASAYTKPDLKMRFADYLNIIEKDEHTDLRIFLFDLFKHNPELKQEFPCPEIFKGFMDKFGFMFFGGKDTTVRIHYDIDMCNVLHTHFGGKKRAVLFRPNAGKQLYCLPLNTYSLIDIDKPDFETYPALRHLRGSEVILEHGDSLFMPSGWWHYMTYLEGSFSVSYRKLPFDLGSKMQGILNLGVFMPADKTMNKLLGPRWLAIKKGIADKRASVPHIYKHIGERGEVLGI